MADTTRSVYSGTVVLHRGLLTARASGQAATQADILRELAFVDIQAGRHASAERALREATRHAAGDQALLAGITALGIGGTNQFEVEESYFEHSDDRAAAHALPRCPTSMTTAGQAAPHDVVVI